MNLNHKPTQTQIANVLGITQPRVSEFETAGVWDRGCTLGEAILAYSGHLREVAAGRASSEIGGLDLVQERAALAREQRIGHQIKNEVAQKTYAPISLLSQTLAMASQAVVERFDQLPGALKRACPELPEAARHQVAIVIAAARNEWVERTAQMMAEGFMTQLDDEDFGEGSAP